ncbi:Uma2 family endonuclease [Actinomadura sp. 9N407]|uniref:Uma2 family endonuclease n=1 Tax=Actinomadura sp. 9N407 TaxID=3375154 RepID=UPI003792D35B
MAADMEHDPRCVEEQRLLNGFLELDTPEGYRAEFIEGEIVVSPPPFAKHEKIVARIIMQVRDHAATIDFAGQVGLRLDRGERCTKNLLIPDTVFAPLEFDVFEVEDPWIPPHDLLMVVEVTSGKPERDRGVKRHCYAKAGIPLYLLVDRSEQTVTLFNEPDQAAEDYREDVRVGFGKPVELPEPFSFTLDTGEFA